MSRKILIVVVILSLLGGLAYSLISRPTQIAYIGETNDPVQSRWSSTTTRPTDSSGCYYKEVQCFKAPCDPILVCPSPAPTKVPAASPVPVSSRAPEPSPIVVCSTSPARVSFSSPCNTGGFAQITYQCQGGISHSYTGGATDNYNSTGPGCQNPRAAMQDITRLCCLGR